MKKITIFLLCLTLVAMFLFPKPIGYYFIIGLLLIIAIYVAIKRRK